MAGVTSVVIDGTTYLVDDIHAVDFSEAQGLTPTQQQQGRSNIGAAAQAALAGKADKSDVDALESALDDLSDDVAEFTEALADKADVIVDTASGAIASFPDGAAVTAKNITIGIEPVQSGSGDPSPTNVRPISGWTGANVTRTGKNLFGGDKFSVDIVSKVENASRNPENKTCYYAADKIKNIVLFTEFKPSTRYSFYFPTGSKATNLTIVYSDGSNTAIGTTGVTVSTESKNVIALSGMWNTGTTTLNYEYCGVMEGVCTVDDFLANTYSGTTIPISWQSEAGTVYGGTLDVTTGLLTMDRAMVTLDGSEDESFTTGGYDMPFRTYLPDDALISTSVTKLVGIFSNQMKEVTQESTWGRIGTCSVIIGAHSLYFKLTDDLTEVSALRTYLASNPMQLCYILAVPLNYQLTPTEVEMLLGENNVWADTGDTTVTYRADTKLYIQKINAPTDDDMIADAQIASGKYFIVGGNLYKSTTTIPAGDAITPGTNCILTNLADALNALNT